MKTVIYSITATLSTVLATQAFGWTEIASCNQGAMVIDEECGSYRNVPCYTRRNQIVIRDQGVVEHFRQGRADGYYSYNAGNPFWSFHGSELIIRIEKDGNGGYTGTNLVGLNIPYADDAFLAHFYIKREGDGLYVEAYKHGSTRNDIVPQGRLADWFFESCTFTAFEN